MVFDRRFNAASPRYLGSASNAQQQNDGLRPPLQDYCVLLTRSFLMVLGGAPHAWIEPASAQVFASQGRHHHPDVGPNANADPAYLHFRVACSLLR